MKLVVDSNIFFSSLIKEGRTKELLLDLSLDLYAPEFILEEFEKHEQEILDKTNRTKEEFNNILSIIEEIINLVPKEDFEDCLVEAEKISPDPDDVMYFALALKLNCSIWSNDKNLKKQDKIKVYSTEEIIEKFSI